MWANFHSHSQFCDGVGELRDYAEAAVANGFITLGFSAHAPVPFECSWCMSKVDLEDYLKSIESLRNDYPSLQIYKGMEVDFIPGVVSPTDFKPVLDYTIGSIHFIETFANGKPWEIDGSHSIFEQGLKEIFTNNIQEAIVRYFELTREMVTTGQPDMVGHLDKIKIQNRGDKYFKESDPWYKAEIIKTLDVIAKEGKIVEVNTRGLYQKKSTTPYPSPWILEMVHQRNIAITLSSDAHNPVDLTNQFEQTAALLLAIGFKKISILRDRSWQAVTLTANGITL